VKIRTRKILRGFAILSASLLFLLAVFLIEEHIRGRIELNRYIAQMCARGEKFTISELAPIPAPPDENGAGMFMGAGFPQSDLLSRRLAPSMRFIAAGTAIPAASLRAWSVSGESDILPTTNIARFAGPNVAISAASTNVQVGRARDQTVVSGRGQRIWKTVTADDLANELAPHSNSLAQVRAALAYPQLDYGLDYSQGFNVSYSHLPREKTASQWLRAASFSALQATNLDAALENLVALAALSHATTNDALMIGQLVRMAILHITVAAIWEALQVDGWNDAQLARLQAALASNDFVSAMTRTFEMERAMGAMTIDRAAADSAETRAFLETDMEWSPPSLPENAEEAMEPLRNMLKNGAAAFNRFIYFPAWRFAWKEQDKLYCMQYWQSLIDDGRRQASRRHRVPNPTRTDADMAVDDTFRLRSGSQYNRLRFVFSDLLVGAGEKGLDRAVTAEAAQQLAVSAIAIRRYEVANGKVPGSLDELAPKFLLAVPLDPFDDKPLRYKRNQDGSFTLYSIGANRKDDGGDASPPMNRGRPNFAFNMRDIVWPRAATAEQLEKFIEAEAARSRNSTSR
jgi:hypothetical protein